MLLKHKLCFEKIVYALKTQFVLFLSLEKSLYVLNNHLFLKDTLVSETHCVVLNKLYMCFLTVVFLTYMLLLKRPCFF